ncbi:MAG: HEPN domain-containing protein [Bdellovibrionota bacterium]
MALTQEAGQFWLHCFRAIRSAQVLLEDEDYDGAVSKAYYAAFYAVKALFLLEGKSFKTHKALDSAVNADLVRTHRWPKELAKTYRKMMKDRNLADYEMLHHFTKRQAEGAIQLAWKIAEGVAKIRPDTFVVLQKP